MKYFVKVVSGVAVQIYRSDKKWSDTDYEITESQFAGCALPCKIELTDEGIVFVGQASWDEVPIAETVSGVPEPELEAPESTEVSWDAMAEAILEGVNDV